MSRFALSRRTLLRGAQKGLVATIALPALDAMFNSHGTAHADGTAMAKRFGVWFWGNGVRPDKWLPKGEGSAWTASESLAPLESVKDLLTVVSGLQVKISGTAHHVGRAAMLSGAYDQAGGLYGVVDGPSVDQVVANAWRGKTSLPSIQMGISMRSKGGVGANKARGGTSWAGRNQSLPSTYVPTELFRRFFGDLSGAAAQAERMRQFLVRKSVLDLVGADAKALKARLGKNDAQRIEEHLTGLRSLESTLTIRNTVVCDKVKAMPVDPTVDLGHELLEERNKVMAELLALALSCDLTRVFSYEYSGMQADTIFWQVGATEGSHVMTHDDRGLEVMLAPQYEKVAKVAAFLMGEYRVLIERLRSIPEGAGNLMDNSLIYATSELNDGTAHSYSDMPIVLAGKAGGALRFGQHYRSKTKENTTSLLLTLVRALGLPDKTFGKGGAASDQVIAALLT